ncbi:LysM peptidoglycan-binding domain-containing protein [Enterococcus sp. BWB1-3]|uniref:aggregation-promoting factor n=1 Tax=unclassified Enterococcus TaxID=2608891 RepID=UPI001923A83C|nr:MULTISPECIES: LysM peptidoglycan-binding domain-containing protein [unclassified Enterococcus]MBL1228824.1 LysM peptidoglycan-binding domain-containing protein [Enterococcus sp. BWB1-3]MCB5954725.1 LysM peptidoglycan-binding domain-containing protein [Enterococcus sp. CWB-B31]
MRSIKTILLGTILAAGFGIFVGTTDVHADTLYTVQSGDSLSKISQQFGGDANFINKIAEDNNIDNIHMIYVGQELVIKTGEGTEIAAAPATAVQVETQPAAQPAATESAAASAYTGTSSSAKEWIAQKESNGSYTATNGRYIGRYQLDSSYLNGDYSAENQERVADQYVAQRYGSWEAAQAFWLANGWY